MIKQFFTFLDDKSHNYKFYVVKDGATSDEYEFKMKVIPEIDMMLNDHYEMTHMRPKRDEQLTDQNGRSVVLFFYRSKTTKIVVIIASNTVTNLRVTMTDV